MTDCTCGIGSYEEPHTDACEALIASRQLLRERIRAAVGEANVPDANEYDPALVNDDVTDAVMKVITG